MTLWEIAGAVTHIASLLAIATATGLWWFAVIILIKAAVRRDVRDALNGGDE